MRYALDVCYCFPLFNIKRQLLFVTVYWLIATPV